VLFSFRAEEVAGVCRRRAAQADAVLLVLVHGQVENVWVLDDRRRGRRSVFWQLGGLPPPVGVSAARLSKGQSRLRAKVNIPKAQKVSR